MQVKADGRVFVHAKVLVLVRVLAREEGVDFAKVVVPVK